MAEKTEKEKKPERPPFTVSKERAEEIDTFIASDPIAKPLLLYFDALRLRGVDATQAARTSSLLVGATPPEQRLYDRLR